MPYVDGYLLPVPKTKVAQYRAIARKAIERKSGARGLRSVMEERMLDVMFDLPSEEGVSECVMIEQVINDEEKPVLLYTHGENEALE